MSNVSGYEDVYTPQGVETDDPAQKPNEQRDDYLVRVSRKNIRSLEDRAREATAANERAAAAERKAAFALAGIDITSDKGAFFARGYEGDLDPAKIREAAAQFNVVEPPKSEGENSENGGEGDDQNTPSTPDPKLEEGEDRLHEEQNRLAGNSPGDQPQQGDPYKDAEKVATDVLQRGGQEKEALGAFINSVVNAAHRGDKRVVLAQRDNAE